MPREDFSQAFFVFLGLEAPLQRAKDVAAGFSFARVVGPLPGVPLKPHANLPVEPGKFCIGILPFLTEGRGLEGNVERVAPGCRTLLRKSTARWRCVGIPGNALRLPGRRFLDSNGLNNFRHSASLLNTRRDGLSAEGFRLLHLSDQPLQKSLRTF